MFTPYKWTYGQPQLSEWASRLAQHGETSYRNMADMKKKLPGTPSVLFFRATGKP